MDAVNDPETEEIVVMSSAQVGKSEIVNNIIGYHIDYDPSSMLLMQPTLEMAKHFQGSYCCHDTRYTYLIQKVNSPKQRMEIILCFKRSLLVDI